VQLFEVVKEVKVEKAEEVKVGVVGEEVEVKFQDSEMGEEAAEDGSTANHDEEGAEVEVEDSQMGEEAAEDGSTANHNEEGAEVEVEEAERVATMVAMMTAKVTATAMTTMALFGQDCNCNQS
jgi:hypothetical protein